MKISGKPVKAEMSAGQRWAGKKQVTIQVRQPLLGANDSDDMASEPGQIGDHSVYLDTLFSFAPLPRHDCPS